MYGYVNRLQLLLTKQILHKNFIVIEHNSLLQNTAMYRSVTISVIYDPIYIKQILIIKYCTLTIYEHYAAHNIYFYIYF